MTLECLAALATLTPQQRETWIDHRLVGLTQRQLAARDHVSPQAIHLRLLKADARLAQAVRPDHVLVAA